LPVLRASGTGKGLEQASFLSGGHAAEVFVMVKAARGFNGGWGGFGAYTDLHVHYPYDYVYETFGLANDRVTYYNYSDTGHYNVYNISAASGSGAYVIRLGSVTSTYTQNIGWSSSKFYLFRDGLDNFQFEGDIGEILVYNRVLTDSERTTVKDYLVGRWAL
jgi:hypothetical protein